MLAVLLLALLPQKVKPEAPPEPKGFYEVVLPAGEHGSINIAWFKNGATIMDPKTWLDQGYVGIRFTGQGPDKTTIRCTSWDGITLAVGRHPGTVVFKDLTVIAGSDRATAFGQQNTAKVREPKFQVNLVNVHFRMSPLGSYGISGAEVVGGGDGYLVGDVVRVADPSFGAVSMRVESVDPTWTEAQAKRAGALALISAPTVGERAELDALLNLPGAVTRLAVVSGQGGVFGKLAPRGAHTIDGSGLGLTVALSYRRPKWLVFSYNADLYLKGCQFNGKDTAEHALYAHGFASRGMLIEGCRFLSSGAEGIKVRSDATETAWAGPEAKIVIRDTYVANWHQPHSWRGGAGMVFQGAGCDILIERCLLKGSRALGSIPANDRSKAIMISSEGVSYDAVTGAVNEGYGNGHVVIRDTIAWGHSDVDWRNTLIRCDQNSGSQFSARSLLIEGCGLWGQNMAITAGAIPTGGYILRGCNTPALGRRSRDLGIDTTFQAYIPTASKKLLASEGLTR